ncbi:MAG TPA: hypothetical protein VMT61_04545 [Candidatus Binataceae bacterium]|nr:hypothetical protein [Candidatus Binataceae bacterium]
MQREAEQRHTLIYPHGWAFVWYCTCGLFAALSVMLNAAVWRPVLARVNVTEKVHWPPF